MGASNYNRLSKTDSGYIRYNLIIRASFKNKIILTARYSKAILTTVQENLEGILRIKEKD